MTTTKTQQQKLFDENLGLVYHIAQRYHYPPEANDDVIQEGMLVLWKAAGAYDPDHGAAFSTFAGRALERAFADYTSWLYNVSGLSASSDTRRRAFLASVGKGQMKKGWDRLFIPSISLDQPLDKYGNDDNCDFLGDIVGTEDDLRDMESEDISKQLSDAMRYLSDDDRELLEARYGLHGTEPVSCRELAMRHGVHHNAISMRTKKAIERLSEHIPLSTRLYL